MADTYEVEVKTLLGSQESADALRARLQELDPSCVLTATSRQLNHYFEGGDITALVERMESLVSPETAEKMRRISREGKKISVRTREADGDVRIVLKASLGDDSSANGVARIEIEESIPGMTLADLDATLEAAGYTYQAKWSRSREEYATGPVVICLDKNAGYGYLAEFEKVVEHQEDIAEAREHIATLMQTLGVEELPQDRLERMFEYYNRHWPEYYGTDNLFVIE